MTMVFPGLFISYIYPPNETLNSFIYSLLDSLTVVLNFALMCVITTMIYHLKLTLQLVSEEEEAANLDQINRKERKSAVLAISASILFTVVQFSITLLYYYDLHCSGMPIEQVIIALFYCTLLAVYCVNVHKLVRYLD